MKDLSTYCEGLLDSDFGGDDDMLLSNLTEFFPGAELSASGKTLTATYNSRNHYEVVFNGTIREKGFEVLKIVAPKEETMSIYFASRDEYLMNFTIDAPGIKLQMDGCPRVFDNVAINTAGVRFIRMHEYKWHKTRIDVGEDGKILLELPYAAKHSMDAGCKFNCGLLGIGPLNAYDAMHKKIVKLGYSDVTMNSTLEREEYFEKPLLRGIGINPKSWPNLKNVIISMTDGRAAKYGLEFFNRHKAAITWGHWTDEIVEFADGWEGGPSSNFNMAFYL